MSCRSLPIGFNGIPNTSLVTGSYSQPLGLGFWMACSHMFTIDGWKLYSDIQQSFGFLPYCIRRVCGCWSLASQGCAEPARSSSCERFSCGDPQKSEEGVACCNVLRASILRGD